MSPFNQNSQQISAFRDFSALEKGLTFVGYAALISKYGLSVPAPDTLCAIGKKHRKYDSARWRIFTPRHKPKDSLQGHLTFALKYEGLDLGLLKALFEKTGTVPITEIIHDTPTSAYSRKIWFLYEWLCEKKLDIEDATQGNFVPLINDKLQYSGPLRDSPRHRVRNNLPGTQAFCPLIRKTEKLDRFIKRNLSQVAKDLIGLTPPNLASRAAAFLLLKDSKASYTIEGEDAPHNRIERWGKIIGQAGLRDLSVDELEYLQSLVIADSRFVTLGCRIEGGFIGDHDRMTGMPMPVHISARPDDLQRLLSGLMETHRLLAESDYNPVLMAALIAFGFVFIHPFEDGNGRIHRYLFHHVLAEKNFVSKGLVFPVSAVIMNRLEDYRKTLEHFSKPRIDLISWRPNEKGNLEVRNKTINLYRYFDATRQAEFLFECVEETVNLTLPEELNYLSKYDQLNHFIKNQLEMPNKKVDQLIRFLNQNNGRLSKRAQNREFIGLTSAEIQTIERQYDDIFHGSV